jgi:hypothetical protein
MVILIKVSCQSQVYFYERFKKCNVDRCHASYRCFMLVTDAKRAFMTGVTVVLASTGDRQGTMRGPYCT